MSQDYWLQSFINENNIRDDFWRGGFRPTLLLVSLSVARIVLITISVFSAFFFLSTPAPRS